MLEQELRNIVTRVEESFIVPEYHEVRIRYVEKKRRSRFLGNTWTFLKRLFRFRELCLIKFFDRMETGDYGVQLPLFKAG